MTAGVGRAADEGDVDSEEGSASADPAAARAEGVVSCLLAVGAESAPMSTKREGRFKYELVDVFASFSM